MIQIIRVERVNSLADYLAQQKDINIERPNRCPSKACGKSECFWKHTGYKRKARDGELEGTVLVQRFLCKYCGLVISCLFDFLVPYVIFAARVVAEAARCYASETGSYRQLAETLGGIEEDGDGGVLRPSHNQIFCWVKHLAFLSRALLLPVQRFAVRTNQLPISERYLACPNRWKAFTAGKRVALDDLLRLFVQSALCCGSSGMSAGEWLHRYFLKNMVIFTCRQVKLSAQQRT